MFRAKYAIPFIVCVGLLAGAGLSAPWWIRLALEKGGTTANEAKVEIDYVRISLFPLGLHIYDIQVTNPKAPFRNRVQIDHVDLELDTRALLEKKYILNVVAVRGISLDTPRTTSGALDHPIPKTPKSALAQEMESRLWGQLDQIQAIIPDIKLPKPENLGSVKAYNEAMTDIQTTHSKWDGVIKGKTIEGDLNAVNTSVQALQKAAAEPLILPRDLGKINSMIGQAKTTLQQVEVLSKRVGQIQTDFNADSSRLTSRVGGIQKAAQADVLNSLKPFQLKKPHFNLGTSYLLEPIQTRLLPYMDKMRLMLMYKDKFSFPKPHFKLSRDPGEDIAFQAPRHYPKFWVKLVLISGRGHQGERIEGRIQDVCSNPLEIKKPLLARLSGTHLFRSDAAFQIQFSQYPVGKVKQNSLLFSVQNIPLKPRVLIHKESQTISLSRAKISFVSRTTLIGPMVDSLSHITVAPLDITTMGITTASFTMESVLADVLRPIHSLFIGLNLRGPYKHLQAKIQSNIDSQISNGLHQAFQHKLSAAQAEAQRQVDAAIADKKAEAERTLNAYQDQVQSWITQQTKQLDILKASLETIQKKGEKELESKMTNKVQGVLNQLFR